MAVFTHYRSFLLGQYDGSHPVDFNSDTIKIMLLKDVHVPDASSHQFLSDIETDEVTGGNYTAGGIALSSLTCVYTGTPGVDGKVTFDAADPTWDQHASGFDNAKFAVLYKSTGTSSTSPLIAYSVLPRNYDNVNGIVTLRFSTNGIMVVTSN